MTCSPLLLLLLQEQVAQGYLSAIQALCEFDYVRDNPLLRQFQLAYRLLTPAASYRSAVFTFLRLVSGRDEVSPSRYRGVSVRRRGSRGPDRFSGHFLHRAGRPRARRADQTGRAAGSFTGQLVLCLHAWHHAACTRSAGGLSAGGECRACCAVQHMCNLAASADGNGEAIAHHRQCT